MDKSEKSLGNLWRFLKTIRGFLDKSEKSQKNLLRYLDKSEKSRVFIKLLYFIKLFHVLFFSESDWSSSFYYNITTIVKNGAKVKCYK